MPLGKHDYYCPSCKNHYSGFASWRAHCHSRHNGHDPRYPNEISEGFEKVDKLPEGIPVELECTWKDCAQTRKSVDELWRHFEQTHGIRHTQIQEGTKLQDELAEQFYVLLDTERRLDDEDRKAGR